MKKVVISLILMIGSAAALASKIDAQYSQNGNKGEKIRGNADELPLIDNPEPRLKNNNMVLPAKLKSIDKLKDISRLPKEAKILSVKQKSWKALEKEKGGSRFHGVAEDRQIYEQVVSYPMLEHPTVGRVKNAVVTHAFDAETGEFLFEEVRGDDFLDTSKTHPPQPTTAEVRQEQAKAIKAYCDAGVEVMCQELKKP